jgi:hypothetical protein
MDQRKAAKLIFAGIETFSGIHHGKTATKGMRAAGEQH